MSRLALSVRIAAGSILLLSVVHILFWLTLAVASHSEFPAGYPYDLFFPIALTFAAAGLSGIVVGVGIFRARSWARIAALGLAALVALFCAFAMLVSVAVTFVPLAAGLGVEATVASTSELMRLALVYLVVLSVSVWWIFLFSRKTVAAQFFAGAVYAPSADPKKPSCPPPIALLAWLMIFSSALSAASWPLILGRIPAMLFTHIFSVQMSKFIWAANILLFLACGIGLLKLQRRSYDATVTLHFFWLVSLLVTQLSANYDAYTRLCITTLQLAEAYPMLNHLHFPRWVSAVATALPTALLIAGLFYYRPAFLKAVQDSQHPSSSPVFRRARR
jgi:hypothetical protein